MYLQKKQRFITFSEREDWCFALFTSTILAVVGLKVGKKDWGTVFTAILQLCPLLGKNVPVGRVNKHKISVLGLMGEENEGIGI